jgi:hypothetical protein
MQENIPIMAGPFKSSILEEASRRSESAAPMSRPFRGVDGGRGKATGAIGERLKLSKNKSLDRCTSPALRRNPGTRRGRADARLREY